MRGMVRACEKTGVSLSKLGSIVDEIEARLQQKPKQEITSGAIGQMVLEHLKQESEVAYVRFASVYGHFQGIRDFVDTLNELQSKEETNWQYAEDSSVITST
jgi:transcriptional repressor NrdR